MAKQPALDFGSGRGLGVHEFECPHLSNLSLVVQILLGILSASLSAPPMLGHALSLSLKNKIDIKKIIILLSQESHSNLEILTRYFSECQINYHCVNSPIL